MIMVSVNVEEFQKAAKDNLENSIKSLSVVTKGVQAISAEVADYSKKSFEQGSAALEKLIGSKSLDKAIEVQTEYAKTAYEGYVAQMNKVGELYVDLAKEIYKPYEGFLAKVSK
jgi:hypothetical protein